MKDKVLKQDNSIMEMTALISNLNIMTLFIYIFDMAELWFGRLNITMYTEVVMHSMNAYVWCWGKPVAHLMKFHLLQWEAAKVKFLMNSNMTLTVLNLYQKTDPKVEQDFIGQGHYGKAKGQIKVRP